MAANLNEAVLTWNHMSMQECYIREKEINNAL